MVPICLQNRSRNSLSIPSMPGVFPELTLSSASFSSFSSIFLSASSFYTARSAEGLCQHTEIKLRKRGRGLKEPITVKHIYWSPVIGRHGSWGLSHISKPVLKYLIIGQAGSTHWFTTSQSINTSYRLVGNWHPHLVSYVEQVVRAGQLHLRTVSRASAFKLNREHGKVT